MQTQCNCKLSEIRHGVSFSDTVLTRYVRGICDDAARFGRRNFLQIRPKTVPKLAGTAGAYIGASAMHADEHRRQNMTNKMNIPSDICPVVRELGIRLANGPWWDGDTERTSVLAPLAPRLIDARSGAVAGKRRAKHAAHVALCEFAPLALEAAASHLAAKGIADHAAILRRHAVGLRRLPSADAAYAAAGAASAAEAAYAYEAAASAADADYVAETAAEAAEAAADAAEAAADAAADAAMRKAIRDRLAKLIDECIEIC